jgi:integrase
LEWRDVGERTLRIRSETVKTKQAHEIPLTGEIAVIIERAAKYRTPMTRLVFHRNSQPLLNNWCEVQWKRAAMTAGLGHILIHDLRRSFVRNMRLAGMPEIVIMRFTGHKTRAVFDRYSIVSIEEQQSALERMTEYLAGQGKEPTVRKMKQ